MERDSARGAIQPGLKILTRYIQTGNFIFGAEANISARAEVRHVIATKFQPGLKFAM